MTSTLYTGKLRVSPHAVTVSLLGRGKSKPAHCWDSKPSEQLHVCARAANQLSFSTGTGTWPSHMRCWASPDRCSTAAAPVKRRPSRRMPSAHTQCHACSTKKQPSGAYVSFSSVATVSARASPLAASSHALDDLITLPQ